MMDRRLIRSGIPGLDEILGGGLLEGSIIAVSGPTGSGRSTMAFQFLYNGAMEHGEPGLYISIEESKQDFFFHMSGYTWDLDEAERQRKLIFLDYPIYEVDQILAQYGAIQEIINSTGVKRVVIDSIMPIALFFPDEEERKKGFLKLIDNVRKWGVTTMIVAETTQAVTKGGLPKSSYGIESFTDGWINLHHHYDEARNDRVRSVEVIKMKGMRHSTKNYPAEIGVDGFTVSSDRKPAEKKAPPPEPVKKVDKKTEKAVKKAAKKTIKTMGKTLGIRKKI